MDLPDGSQSVPGCVRCKDDKRVARTNTHSQVMDLEGCKCHLGDLENWIEMDPTEDVPEGSRDIPGYAQCDGDEDDVPDV